jgi:hypothetical protein
MPLICNIGEIDEKKDTVKHYGDMDDEKKALILSDINIHSRKRVFMTNAVAST